MITTKSIVERFGCRPLEDMIKSENTVEAEKLAIAYLINDFNIEQIKVIEEKIKAGKKGWDNLEYKKFFTARLRERCLMPSTEDNLIHIANLAMIIWNMEV